MSWNADDLASALQVDVASKGWSAERFSIDSRTIQPGEIFIALQGEKMDGHHYVKAALDAGAEIAIVHHIVEGVDAQRQVLVDDTFDAMYELAAYHRARLDAKLVGVTGSVGKTGAKEALRLALATKGETYATSGNYNNHIGLPLCLINMPLSSKFGVFEMGMNHAGEISRLSVLLKPHLAMITTVESVHIEFFDSEEAIADAKAEIFHGMDKNGIAALPFDNPHFVRLKKAAEKHGLGRVISFGVNELAMCRLLDYKASLEGAEVTATICGTPVSYRLGAMGRHWALTSVAVLAAAEALGANLPKAAEALASFREPKGRGRMTQVSWGDGEILLVDDSYNASPSSMAAACEKLAELKRALSGRRTVAVLGDMLELGDLAPRMHAGLAKKLEEAKVDEVHTAGTLMAHLHKALPANMKGQHAADAPALTEELQSRLHAGDVVLVKGSHGSGMWKLAEALQANGGESNGNGGHAHAV